MLQNITHPHIIAIKKLMCLLEIEKKNNFQVSIDFNNFLLFLNLITSYLKNPNIVQVQVFSKIKTRETNTETKFGYFRNFENQ